MKAIELLNFISEHPWTSLFVAIVFLSVLDCIKDTIIGVSNKRHTIEIKKDSEKEIENGRQ